jgi:drug/metabolite transporter (DMT)-like permease
VGIRFIVHELPPFWGAVLRYLPAALILFMLSLVFRLPLPKGRSLLGAVLFGVLGFGISFGLIFWGLQEVPAGMGQVIGALGPLLTLIFAVLHSQESFHWRALLGSLLAVGGVAIVFTQQLSVDIPLIYTLAILLATISNAEAGILLKMFPISHPIPTNAVSMAAGALVQLLLSLLSGEPRPLPQLPATWIALVYLILIGSCVVFILAVYLLKHWKASTTSYVFVLLPFVTIAASALLDNEKITVALIAGGLLVLLGVYIGVLSKAVQPHKGTVVGSEKEALLTKPIESSD